MESYPRILILMDTDRAYERGIVMGFLKYSRLHGPLNFIRSESEVLGGLHKLTLARIKQWRPDGLLWREGHSIKHVDTLGLPTIYCPTSEPDQRFCNIRTDDPDIGDRVARHLLSRGLEHFAYCGLDDLHYWSRLRKQGFLSAIEGAGFEVSTFDLLARKGKLAEWLSQLQVPCGMMICTDDCSVEIYDAIRRLNLRVPEDLALVGVGNDEIVCDFSTPPLSSVQLNLEEAGFKAAQRLHRMIEGESLNEDIVVEAFDVVERHSSNFLAIKDPLVALALKFIHEHRNQPVCVGDVVKAVPASRRMLYRLFKKHLGRSIAEEIRIVRINQAARMLIDTNLNINEICEELGFAAPQNFSRSFLREKGVTPFKYRVKHMLYK